jgi:hypothetical protein
MEFGGHVFICDEHFVNIGCDTFCCQDIFN